MKAEHNMWLWIGIALWLFSVFGIGASHTLADQIVFALIGLYALTMILYQKLDQIQEEIKKREAEKA